MRISDWSSDVCSSDLLRPRAGRGMLVDTLDTAMAVGGADLFDHQMSLSSHGRKCSDEGVGAHLVARRVAQIRGIGVRQMATRPGRPLIRSEEHTSELQSLMRISYAVFCLKKKKKLKHN